MKHNTIIFCDFDGTIFDPDIRLIGAPLYNVQSSRIIRTTKSIFVVTTGRHSWDLPSRFHYSLTGMLNPEIIICGAGTEIYWKKNNKYVLDQKWDARMNRDWVKGAVQEKLQSFLHKHHLGEHRVPNPYMLVVRLYGKSLDDTEKIQGELNEHLIDMRAKVILSEQLFLPNNPHVFNGYALIVPEAAGKECSARYVIDEYKKQYDDLDVLAFGDASIDIPLLTMKKPSDVRSFKAYGMHLTPLARRRADGAKLENGSSPKSIYTILSTHFKSPLNSPYRALLGPFESFIDRKVHPGYSPDELTKLGLDDVRSGLDKGGMKGFLRVVKGHLLDAADGIRARRHPELRSEKGQLVDVYADRMKEFEELVRRGRYDIALTCTLPSIARAQAEALGKTVPELDRAGGSSLTRTHRLLTSLFFHTVGFTGISKKIDENLAAANLNTFRRRRRIADDFSWNISSLKTYHHAAVERLILLVEILQEQYEEASRHHKTSIPEILEYLAVKPATIRTQLKLPVPEAVSSL